MLFTSSCALFKRRCWYFSLWDMMESTGIHTHCLSHVFILYFGIWLWKAGEKNRNIRLKSGMWDTGCDTHTVSRHIFTLCLILSGIPLIFALCFFLSLLPKCLLLHSQNSSIAHWHEGDRHAPELHLVHNWVLLPWTYLQLEWSFLLNFTLVHILQCHFWLKRKGKHTKIGILRINIFRIKCYKKACLEIYIYIFSILVQKQNKIPYLTMGWVGGNITDKNGHERAHVKLTQGTVQNDRSIESSGILWGISFSQCSFQTRLQGKPLKSVFGCYGWLQGKEQVGENPSVN